MTDLTRVPRAVLRPVKRMVKRALSPEFRQQEQAHRRAFEEFKRQTEALRRTRMTAPDVGKTVLVVSSEIPNTLYIELALVEAMRQAGFSPVVLTFRNEWLQKRYRTWGFDRVICWEDFIPADTLRDLPELKTFDDVLRFEVAGARVGKYVASRIMRWFRVGSFDPHEQEIWAKLEQGLVEGIGYAHAACRIVEAVRPDAALFLERGYSPWGQLFDVCLQNGVDVMQWCMAHKDNALMLKRYTPGNEGMHPCSLSEDSWTLVRKMPWGKAQAKRFQEELYGCYATGQWYNEVGTQFNKQMQTCEDLRKQLGLHPGKKTAVVFAHMFWDATFFFGRDLFKDYEDWFVQTIQAAAKNTELDWIVKVHPANVVKDRRDGYKGEPSELLAIRKHIGALPSHIKLIEADSPISTFSLFSLMDYCLTVRGTVGIEAASLGVRVLTAGTGRYDHLGFTLDSESAGAYLQLLSHLQDVEPLSAEEHELAQRFAYAAFLMRPFLLQSVSLTFKQDAGATASSAFHVGSMRALIESSDMQVFAEWACRSRAEDFLQTGQ